MELIPAPPKEFCEFILGSEPVVIASHDKPDGDCLASSMALARYLESRKREVLLYNPGPFSRREIRHYKERFSQVIPAKWLQRKPALLTVDCASHDRLGDIGSLDAFGTIAVVDHHSSTKMIGSVRYVAPRAPATALMAQRIIEHDRPLEKNEAEHILFGFLTDSGFFRHIHSEPAEVFAYVTRLLQFGFSLHALYRRMYGGVKFKQHHLVGRILERSEQFLNGKLIVAVKTQDDSQYFAGYLNGEAVYGSLILTSGVEVVALINELPDEGFDISLRSTKAVNVGALAAQYGGGGHVAAAGYRWRGSLDQLKMQLIHDVSTAMQ